VPLPETVRVKLSPENAGYVSLAPVVTRDMPLGELIELMLGVAGKSAERIAELLRAGALVHGATRFRWQGFPAEPAELAGLLAAFPDPEPSRPFSAARCVRAVLSGGGRRLEISREAGERRRWLRRASFWEALLSLAAEAPVEYREYCYQERADCYRLRLTPAAAERLRRQAGLLRYSALEQRVRGARFEQVDFYVRRA